MCFHGWGPLANNTPDHGTCQSACLSWVMGFSSLPAHGIIQISQSHPPVATKGYLPWLLLQSLPPTDPAHSFSSQVQTPCGSAWCTMFSSSRLWISCCQSHRSRVGCPMFGHPHNSRTGTSPHQWGDKEVIENKLLLNQFTCFFN